MMEHIYKEIDLALLEISRASQDGTEWEYFDFDTALRLLEREKDLKFNLYLSVMKDLFSIIGHAWIEYESIEKEGEKYIVEGVYKTYLNISGLKSETFNNSYDVNEFSHRFESTDIKVLNKDIHTHPIKKIYNLLTGISNGRIPDFYKLEKYIDNRKSLVTENITFENFVKELDLRYPQAQRKIQQKTICFLLYALAKGGVVFSFRDYTKCGYKNQVEYYSGIVSQVKSKNIFEANGISFKTSYIEVLNKKCPISRMKDSLEFCNESKIKELFPNSIIIDLSKLKDVEFFIRESIHNETY